MPSPEPFRFVSRARLLEVHDGDTIVLSLDRGLDGTTTPEHIRLGGPVKGSPFDVYAPELDEPGGPECLAAALAWLEAREGTSWPFVVETWKTRSDVTKTTLARYLGHVTSAVTGESLNTAMRAYVAAHGYGGGTGAPVDSTS